MAQFPDAGKIQHEFFSEVIFPKTGRHRKEVLIGSQYGVDVSVIQLPGGFAMAVSSDPLTLIPSLGLQESAWLSVQILANDMVTTGFAPQYAQFVLNLPVSLTSSDFDTYWNHIHQYCNNIGIAITGGHTGQVVGQNSTVSGGGTMFTVAQEDLILTSNKAKPGNIVIVTKQAALTATSILAMSFPETVKNQAGVDVYQKACDLFYRTTSLQDGLVAALASEGCKDVTAMHDVTEGGVLGAIYEMATASNCGVVIDSDALPIGEVQASVCNVFNIDPRFVVGAGAMIVAVKASAKEAVLKRLQDNHIQATIVGYFSDTTEKIIQENGINQPLIHPGTDAYWNAFYTAFANGWK
jgi:hydrogenase expression/formation protein HypE